MPLRPCLDCRALTDNGTRCSACAAGKQRARDQLRGSSTERGYGADHQVERAAWVPVVAAGGVVCRRAPFGQCVAPQPIIRRDELWHLGHPDASCSAPKAPEHVVCNTGAPRRR